MDPNGDGRVNGNGWRHSLPVRLLSAAVLMLALDPGHALGQRFAIDGEFFGGSASLAWETAPGAALGFALGVMIPQTMVTLEPDREDFSEYLHAAAFYRRRSGAFEGDVGVRLGVGDLYECGASDCWPGVYAGGYGAAFVGWEHVKFGARLLAVSQKDPGERRAFVLALTPLVVRISF
ncbi:MAG TPA: hypothetical protein VFZ93_11015 [Albitalea sp.]